MFRCSGDPGLSTCHEIPIRHQPAVSAIGLVIAGMCPDIFCFHCEKLGHMTDSCPEEVNCCICHVARHMAADCSFS